MQHATSIHRAHTAAEPLFAIGSDDEGTFVGTLAECCARHPECDPESEEEQPVWFGDLRLHLGHLIDPSSPDAQELYRAATGAPNAAVGDVRAWLLNEAQDKRYLQFALAVIAYRQQALKAEHLRQLLLEAGL